MKKIKMVELTPEFQKTIFSQVIKKYGIQNCVELFGKSHSMFYHYKNNRGKAIPLWLVKKVAKSLQIPRKQLKSNILKTFTLEEMCKAIFDKGREKRRQQLKRFRENIPRITELIENNELNVERWLKAYLNLINFGWRQIKNITVDGNKLSVSYTNYANGKKKAFKCNLPRKIKLDEEFLYFFGLWVGDRVGGGRLGVMNKQKEIIQFTEYYLKKLYQKSKKDLYMHLGEIPVLDFKIDKIIKIQSESNGYAISVHTVNGILRTFFHHLDASLDKFLDILPNKYPFFAGLFDAEGNIFHEDGCVRWSCKNKRNIKIFKKYLKQLSLFHRYDGANFVSYNLIVFAKYILPHLRHLNKINDANLICYGKGRLNKRFLLILKIINVNPGKTARELAKTLKRVKVHSQIRFLEGLDYVFREGYPKQIYITKKGSKELLRGGKDK